MRNLNKTIKRVCANCGKEFFALSAEVLRGGGKFCSRSCSAIVRNMVVQRKESNAICSNCEKALYRKPSALTKRTLFFCDRNCRSEYMARHGMRATNAEQCKIAHHNRNIRRERGDKCQICGWKESNCDVHHIIPRSQGGTEDPQNKIVLCPNHHRLADDKTLTLEMLQTFNRLSTQVVNGVAL